jgi:hypothetical protein
MAPFINFTIDHKITSAISSEFIQYFSSIHKNISFYSSDFHEKEIQTRILSLYKQKKFPLRNKEYIHCLIKNIWKDEKVIQAICFRPQNLGSPSIQRGHESSQENLLFLSENNEPISPLFVSNLEYSGKKFLTTLHLVYYFLLINLGRTKDEAYALIQYDSKFIDFRKCDVDYQIDSALNYRGKRTLYKFIQSKYSKFDDILYYVIHKRDGIPFSFPIDPYIQKNMIELFCRHQRKCLERSDMISSRLDYCIRLTNKRSVQQLNFLYQMLVYIDQTLKRSLDILQLDSDYETIRKLFKILFPSIYVLYKSFKEKKRDDEFKKGVFSCSKDKNVEKFLSKIFHAVSFYYVEQKYQNNYKSEISIIKKLCMLYKISNNKDPWKQMPVIFGYHPLETETTMKRDKRYREMCQSIIKSLDHKSISNVHRLVNFFMSKSDFCDY